MAESLDSLRESQRGQIGQVCNTWIYESFLSHAFFSLRRCVRARSRTHDPVSTLQTVQINQINRSPLYRYQMASNSVRPSPSDQKVSAGRSQRNSRGALNSQLIATTKASQGTPQLSTRLCLHHLITPDSQTLYRKGEIIIIWAPLFPANPLLPRTTVSIFQKRPKPSTRS